MAQNRVPEQQEYEHLGAYLRDLRLHFKLDVAEVARRTHIRAKYIQAIEDEQLAQLPGKVYARGYVVTYAEFFGLAAEDFATRYMAQFNGGQPVSARDTAYFVPEPKRRQIARKGGASWIYVAGIVLVVAGGGYLLMQDKQAVQSNAVMDVPDRLVEQLRNGFMPVARNIECVSGANYLSCLRAHQQPVLPSYVTAPPVLYVERADEASAEAEKDEAAEAALMESEAEADAQEAKEEAAAVTPEPKKEAPKAADKPKAEEKPKAQTKPEEEAKKPEKTEAVSAPAPFKRQGEEDPPAAAAVKPEEAKPEDAAPKLEAPAAVEEAKPQTSRFSPSRWFGSDTSEDYQDPNASQQEPWTPRRAR